MAKFKGCYSEVVGFRNEAPEFRISTMCPITFYTTANAKVCDASRFHLKRTHRLKAKLSLIAYMVCFLK